MPVATSLAMTSATTKLYTASAQPGSYTTGGFAALTWVEVGELSNIGDLGGTTTVVQHIPVGTATVVKRSGSVNYGTMNLQGARCTDAGQTALKAAFTSKASVSFKIVYPSALGVTEYFTGIVTSAVTAVGTADQILGFNANLDIDNEIIS